MAKFFLFFVLGISLAFSAGEPVIPLQNEKEDLVPLDFSEETIRDFKEDPDYNYSEAVADDHWWTRFKRYIRLQWQRFLDWMFGDYEAPLLLAILLDILPYLLLGLLLAFILYLFGKMTPGNYLFGIPDGGEIHFSEEEKIIRTRDIKKLIERAVASENYRLAVRYHFLYLLQQLSREEIVVYDPAKTDEEYVLEINDRDLKGLFKKVSRIYDYVWYGDFAPNATDYQKIKREFSRFETLIKPQYE